MADRRDALGRKSRKFGSPEGLEERILLTASNGIFSDQEMVQAILALDVYQRGYNTPGILKELTQVYDFTVGDRSTLDPDLIDGVDHQAIGFYAQEYLGPNGRSVISYRGTDDGFDTKATTADVRNGFGIGAGKPHGPQGKAAVDFYRSIVGEADPFTSEIEVTGQSLGAGLAGYVAALFDKDAVIFAHMPYDRAAHNAYLLAETGAYPPISNSVSGPILTGLRSGLVVEQYWNDLETQLLQGLPRRDYLDPEGVADMIEGIWGDEPPRPIDIDGITSYHVDNEALVHGRRVACLDDGSTSLESPCAPGSDDPIAEARVGHYVEPFAEGLGLVHPNLFERHYQSTFVINAFGYTDVFESQPWNIVMPDIWHALFSDPVAEAAGLWSLDKGEIKDPSVGDLRGLKQAWNPASLMDVMLAYSVINSGQTPFGDTGIRAIYDDATDLGYLTQAGKVPANLEDAIPGLAEVIVQFGAQMARQDVEFADYPDLKPEQGVLSFSVDGELIPEVLYGNETDEADLLSIDLTKALWNLTPLTQRRANDFGPEFDPDRPVRAEGLDEILIDLFDKRSSVLDGASEFADAVEMLYGSSVVDPGFSDSVRVAPYIAQVDFALTDNLTEVRLAALNAEQGIPKDQASLYVSADGAQRIFGTDENNIIVSAASNDVLYGGFGKDILVGRQGSDRMVDLISAPYLGATPLSPDAHDDIYIGGENYELESWATDFFRRWLSLNTIYDIESDLNTLDDHTDAVRYSVRQGYDSPQLAEQGLTVTNVDLTSLGDFQAPRLTIHDPNTGRTSTDHFMYVDTILLSEQGDELLLSDASWDAPAFVHLGNYHPGAVTKEDWDTVSYDDFEFGITMVNGVTRAGDPIPQLPTRSEAKEAEIGRVLNYFFGEPPGDVSFSDPSVQNHLFRSGGFEQLIGTPFDDTLYLNDPNNIQDYFFNWPTIGNRPTVGEIDGGDGNDVIFHQGGEYFAIGDAIPVESGGAVQNAVDVFFDVTAPGQSTAAEVMRMTVRGGQGDDRLMAADGEGTILIGGPGRDFLFNTTFGGQLYGDSVDGVGQSTSGAEDADVFWFWPGTFIMDAQPNDTLEMFGLPLVGGTNGLTGFLSASGGGLAQDWINWSTFYGETTSGQLFVYNPIFDKVISTGPGEGSRLEQVQVIENYDFGEFRDESFGVPAPGDLGMTFRFYVPEGDGLEISIFNSTWGHLITLLDVLGNLAKQMQWRPLDDPLVLDLDDDGIETISLNQSRAYFDLNSDYFRDRTGWLASDDGFLVLDRNDNGHIDDATELFGGPGIAAFEQLAEFDMLAHGGNQDTVIDQRDAIFPSLQVWRDFNQDGESHATELFSLSDVGIVSLDLNTTDLVDTVTPQGTTLLATANFTRSDGTTGTGYEAIFEVDGTDTKYRGGTGLADWLDSGLGSFDHVPDAKGFGSMANLAIDVSNDFALAETVTEVTEAMVTPDLRSLREIATPVFGAWAQSLERSRELAPVLVTDSGDERSLLDHGIYVEDSAGGYWTLASGEAVRDAAGQVMARPTLSDILAQPTSSNAAWRVEQMFSPTSRSEPLQHRQNTAYLATKVADRVVIVDYAEATSDGRWELANLADESGQPITASTLDDLTSQVPVTAPSDAYWEFEDLAFNPYADLPVDRMGVQLVDGQVVDYTVQVSDRLGTFDVWARNLDRALELQHQYGSPGFSLRNYEVNLDALDETGSTDDSAYRVEIVTAGQFHFASSIYGIDFQPEVMYATTDPTTGWIDYTVGSWNGELTATEDAEGNYQSDILPAIEFFDGLMQNYIDVSRAFAVRLALQGGLSEFARELSYTAATDQFRATGDRELAPMFEAIFAGAPVGEQAAYDYLVAWNEILQVVYPDYHLNESTNFVTGTMLRNEAFVFQMLLPAFETVGIDADLPAVLNALGVDETKVITHDPTDTLVEGTRGRDYFYLSSGDQTFRGGDDADIYFVGQNFGHDVIEDIEQPLVGIRAPDQLRFAHAKSTDVIASRDGLDLVIEVLGTDDVLRVKNQFEGENVDPLLKNDISPDTEMVSIVFADGVIWEQFQIADAVSRSLDSDDLVQGSQAKDILQGGRGSDVLRGGRDGDIYLYQIGDGDDRIADDNDRPTDDPVEKMDLLQFIGDITPDDLRFFRDGQSDDVEIRVLDREGNLTEDRLYLEGQFEWINAPFLGLMFPDAIERIAFQDGSFLTDRNVMERVIEQATTDASDIIYGFNHTDRLVGGLGNDVLIGLAQNDTYVFGRGDGQDVISDRDDDFFSESFDVVQFGPELTWSDFTFLREEDSPTIVMQVVDSSDSLTLEDQFREFAFQGFINRIEELHFSDGTVWNWAKLAQHVIDLSATDGDDIIYGFDTDDQIQGGRGVDRLEGGHGADTYYFSRGFGNDTIFDAGSAEQGDTLILDAIAFDGVDLGRLENNLILTIRDTGEQVTIEGQYLRGGQQPHAIEAFQFADAFVEYENLNPEDVDLVGSNAAETLTGTNFGETIDGRGGDDMLIGGSDGDRYLFDLGYGNDVIRDRQVRVAWTDRDGQIEQETDDVIQFGAGVPSNQVVFSKDGDDLLVTVQGATDTLRVQNQFASIEDGVEWFHFTDGSQLHISDIEERLAIVGGGWGDDVIRGVENAANTLDGRQGDDQLFGGRLGDTYAFGAAYDLDQIIESDTTAPGAIDQVIFSAAVDPQIVDLRRDDHTLIIDLGNGQDQLTIVDGLSTRQVERFRFADATEWTLEQVRERLLTGSSQDDELLGFDDRNDVLDGKSGSDLLAAGLGNDRYVFDVGSGQDAILDTGGVDRLIFGDAVTAPMLHLSNQDGDLLVQLRGTDDSVIIRGGVQSRSGTQRIEEFVFADGSVVELANVLRALIADASTPGDDVVDARLGVPAFIQGGPGDDLILGSADTTLQFQLGDGRDVFDTTDQPGESRLVLPDFASTAVSLRRLDWEGPDVIIASGDSGDQLIVRGALTNANLASIAFADGVTWTREEFITAAIDAQATERNDVIVGSARADHLRGLTGDDDIEGGLGDDTFYFNRGDGRDRIRDVRGFDTLEIRGYRPTDTTVTRPLQDREEIVLLFAGSTEQITLPYGGLQGVDLVRFGDDTEWTMAELQEMAIGRGTPFDDAIFGNAADNLLAGGPGNDFLQGNDGNDNYVFSRGGGRDIIEDNGQGDDHNRLTVHDYVASDAEVVIFSDRPNDVTLRFGDGDEVIVIGGLIENGWHIAEFNFADGTTWSLQDVRTAAETRREADRDEVLTGTAANDTLIGEGGADFLSGGDGSDRYLYRPGDGHDVIQDAGQRDTDVLRIEGYDITDALFGVSPANHASLTIEFVNSPEDSITVVNTLDDLIFDQIELVEFVGITSGEVALAMSDVRQRVLAAQRTRGDDVIRGYTTNDMLIAGPGYDRLLGGDGSDTYVYPRGSGATIIHDQGVHDTDVLRIEGYSLEQAIFSQGRAAPSDLVIRFTADTNEEITILNTLNADRLDQVEAIVFQSEDTEQSLSMLDVRARLMQIQATDTDDQILGFIGPDILSGGLGNDYLSGGDGSDTYLFGRGDHIDIVHDLGERDSDTLRITGYTLAQTQFAAAEFDENSLWLRFENSNDQLFVIETLNPNPQNVIEMIEFDTATPGVTETLGIADVRQLVTNSSWVSEYDRHLGSDSSRDEIRGGVGKDWLSGRDQSDTYVFARGDGQDIIDENGYLDTDVLRIEGYTPNEVHLAADIQGNLIVTFDETDDHILIVQGAEGTQPDRIERIEIGGMVWDETAIRAQLLASGATQGDDHLLGIFTDDTLAGGLGQDLLNGRDGSDTYEFHRGDGYDIIEDNGFLDTDVLRIDGWSISDMALSRWHNDLHIQFPDGDRIDVLNTLNLDNQDQIERIEIAGQVWDMNRVRATLLQNEADIDGMPLRGFATDDTFRSGPGSDVISGFNGSDTYIFQFGDGYDLIEDNGSFDNDTLRLEGYLAAEAQVTRAPHAQDNLLLSFANGDRVEVVNTLGGSTQDEIEQFEFDDQTLSLDQIKQRLLTDRYTPFNDTIVGTDIGETLIGGPGDDFLQGRDGADIYRYRRGDGFDVIVDPGAFVDHADQIELVGISVDDVQLQRGLDNDLEILIASSSAGTRDAGRVTVRNSFDATGTQGLAAITFDDGTRWERTSFEQLALRAVATITDDELRGTSDQDILHGLAGNDRLLGLAGDDTYRFHQGDGSDWIRDSGGGRDTLEIMGYAPSETTFSRQGRDSQDLLLRFSSSDQILIVNTLSTDIADQVEIVQFVDTDETFTLAELRQLAVAANGSPAADQILGTVFADALTGLGGDDLIIGRTGDDRFEYHRGDGDVRITDDATDPADHVQIVGWNSNDLTLVNRSPANGLDLVLTFAGRDRLTLTDTLGDFHRGIESITFADGVSWTIADMRAQVLLFDATPFDSQIRGFSGSDVLAGGPGADTLLGGNGSDVYQFNTGDGHDIVDDLGPEAGDVIEVTGYSPREAAARRLFRGSDAAAITFAGGRDSLVVHGLLASRDPGDPSVGTERIRFADGTEWARSDVLSLLDNNTPVARHDGVFVARRDEALLIPVADLLSNDFDADGDPLTIIALQAPLGTARFEDESTIAYDPPSDFVGTTEFSYTVSDGNQGLATTTVTLRVSPQAEAMDDDGIQVLEDESLSISATRLLANDVDGDRMVIAQATDAQNGRVSLASDGTITFTPDADYFGPASFRYIANTPDGGRAEATVTLDVLPVNDAPRPFDDFGFTTAEDTPFNISTAALLANDRDVDGDDVSLVELVSNDTIAVTQESDGALRVAPAFHFFGTATFDYVVEDQTGARGVGTVSVNVTPTNNPPALTSDELTIQEDEPLLIEFAQLLANDEDYDFDPLTIVSATRGVGGRVELFEENSTILFTPLADWFGQAHFFYTVDDGQGGVSQTGVGVQVNPVNDAPTARNESYATSTIFFLDGVAGSPLTISVGDLLQNDSDVDSQQLELASATENQNGTVEIVGDSIVFTPSPEHFGEASFRYVVKDEGGLVDDALVTMYFAPTGSAPPVAVNDNVTMTEDVTTTIPAQALLGNDRDVDNDGLEIASVRMPPDFGEVLLDAEGNVVVTPALNIHGFAYFDYVVTDQADGEDTARVTLNIQPINDSPTANADTAETSINAPAILRIADLLANDNDVDLKANERDKLAFEGVHSTDIGDASIYEGEFIVVRYPQDFTGTATLTYSIADELGVTDEGTVTIEVSSVPRRRFAGTAQRDLIIGATLAETIRSGDGEDAIFAGVGDDWLDGGDGADLLEGGPGFDTVDFFHSPVGVRADLEARIGQGGFAQGDIFENIEAIQGTPWDDELGGDRAANQLIGHAGNDTLLGRRGNDELRGGEGDDWLDGGPDPDLLVGGPGIDTADYSSSIDGVSIALNGGLATGGDAAGDVLIAIENVTGSEANDRLQGSSADNRLLGNRGDDELRGLDGNDVLIGGRGSDQLFGGLGIDRADYTLSRTGVTVDLANRVARGGDAEGDTLDSIEDIFGSFHDDVLSGDHTDNMIQGGPGADTLDGGLGFDTLTYADASAAVSVDLGQGVGSRGDASGDTLNGFEQIIGSRYDDVLRGGAANEVIDGGPGNDELRGQLGSDTYRFSLGAGQDTITEMGSPQDVDTIRFGDGVERRDVTLARENQDLRVELERGDSLLADSLLIVGHFTGPASGIELLTFADGTQWNRDAISTYLSENTLNAVNDIVRLVPEDTEVEISAEQLLRNDVETGHDDLRIISVGNFENGHATLLPNGDIAFSGVLDFHGDAFFDYTVRNRGGRESTARVEVNVLPVNDPPIAANDGIFPGDEDQPLAIPIADLLRNDTDVDGDTLRLTGIFTPLLSADGEPLQPSLLGTSGDPAIVGDDVVFFPVVDHFGYAGFTYEVTDASGVTSVADVELQFVGENDAPRTQTDIGFARLGRIESVRSSSLMFNDRDPEGDNFSVTAVHSATNGTVSLRQETELVNGRVTPVTWIDFEAIALGPATYTYEVTDALGATSEGRVELNIIPLNDPPVARDDAGFTTTEDTPLLIDPETLLQNDLDPEREPLSVVELERFPTNGQVQFAEDGRIQFTPRHNYNGPAGFHYTVSDGHPLGTDTAFVAVEIVVANDPPRLKNDVLWGVEDEPIVVLTGEAFGNDVDAEGDVLFFEDAEVVGVLAEEFVDREKVSASFQASFQKLRSAVAATDTDSRGLPLRLPNWLIWNPYALAFSRHPVDPTFDPDAEPFHVSVKFYGSSSNEPLELIVRVEPAHFLDHTLLPVHVRVLKGGTIGRPELLTASLANGSPLPAWLEFDPESFELRRTETTPDSDTAVRVRLNYPAFVSPPPTNPLERPTPPRPAFSLEVTVDPTEDSTHAISPGIQRWLQGDELFAGPRGDERGWILPADAQITGSLADLSPLPEWLEFDPESLTFSGVPPEGFVGIVPIRIDVGPSDAAQTPPFALISEVYVDTYFTIEEMSNGFGVDVNPEHLEIIRPRDFFGTVVIDYWARDTKDAVSENPGRMFVNVEPRRELPIAAPDSLEVEENGELRFLLGDLLDNDTDGDGDSLRLKEYSEPSVGSWATEATPLRFDLPDQSHLSQPLSHLSGAANASFPDWLEFDPLTGSIFGTPPLGASIDVDLFVRTTDSAMPPRVETTRFRLNIDSKADLTTVYVPPEGYSGPVEMTYVVTDDVDGDATGTVTIHVLPREDPPTANNDLLLAVEDTTLTVDVSELLANDFDVDSDEFAITGVRAGRNGDVQLDQSSFPPQVIFQPSYNFDGAAWFEYTVSDFKHGESTARVDVLVSPNNLPPITVTDRFATEEDTSIVVSVDELLANDMDPEADPIEFVHIEPVGQNGNAFLRSDGDYDLTPRGDFAGQVTYRYIISDGRRESEQTGNLLLDVQAVNDTPEPMVDHGFVTNVNQSITIPFARLLGNDFDVDGDVLRIADAVEPVNGSVVIAGDTAIFTPRADYQGNGGFEYVVSDGQGGLSRGHVHIAVQNDGIGIPVAVSDAAWEIDEDSFVDIQPAELLANDVHSTDAEISFVRAFGPGVSQLPDGNIRYTPAPDANGRFTLQYEIADTFGQTALGRFDVDVRPVNDAPRAVDDEYRGIEDTPISIPLASLRRNDQDVDGHPIRVLSVQNASGGSATLDGVGNVRFVPEPNLSGLATFQYTLADSTSEMDSATVRIRLSELNDAPVAFDDFARTASGHSVMIDVVANDVDVDGNLAPGSLVVTSPPTFGRIVPSAQGTFLYQPDPGFSGEDEFSYVVADERGATSAPAIVRVSVDSDEDTIRPEIIGVFADATQWHPIFRDYVDDGIGGAARGKQLPTQSAAVSLPWFGMNVLRLQFSEDVGASLDNGDFALSLASDFEFQLGQDADPNADDLVSAIPEIAFFEYDETRYIVSLTLKAPLDAGVYDLALDANGVTDEADNPLQTAESSGDYRYRLFVLPGDVDGSLSVDDEDLRRVVTDMTSFLLPSGPFQYNPRLDVDGGAHRVDTADGENHRRAGTMVGPADYELVRRRQGQQLVEKRTE